MTNVNMQAMIGPDDVVHLKVPGPAVTVGSMIEVLNAVYEEGYCNYWVSEFDDVKKAELDLGGMVHNYTYAFRVKDLRDEDTPEWLTVTVDTIQRGVELIMNGEIQLNKHTVESIRESVVMDELGALDSEEMDVVLQAGLFGEIIYG